MAKQLRQGAVTNCVTAVRSFAPTTRSSSCRGNGAMDWTWMAMGLGGFAVIEGRQWG